MSDKIKLIHSDISLKYDAIEQIEEHYSAHFLGEFAVRDRRNNFTDRPMMVFYQPEHPPEHQDIFGLLIHGGRDAIGRSEPHYFKLYPLGQFDEVDCMVSGLYIPDTNELVVSRFRHDYFEHGDIAVDGGRDYSRIVGDKGNAFTVEYDFFNNVAMLDGVPTEVERPYDRYLAKKAEAPECDGEEPSGTDD